MPTPLFILGMNRSGTTWLANQLSQHSVIAAVTHSAHFGVHESAYFSHFYQRYGDLNVTSNFIEFVEVFGASDYARLAGAKKKWLYSQWPTSYEELFRRVMDQFTNNQEFTKYWLEKTPMHTPYVDLLNSLYPDAYFIAITRNVQHVCASSLKRNFYLNNSAKKLKRITALSKLVFLQTYYNKLLNKFNKKSSKIKLITYHELNTSPQKSLQSLCSFLNLSYEDALLQQKYERNTSYHSDTQNRSESLAKSEHFFIYIFNYFMRFIIPLPCMRFLHSVYLKSNGRNSLHQWVFKLYEEELSKNTKYTNISEE